MNTHLEGSVRDVRYAFRNIRNHLRFSLVAICALALGISAVTVVFGVADNVFSRPVPCKDFNRPVRTSMLIGAFRQDPIYLASAK